MTVFATRRWDINSPRDPLQRLFTTFANGWPGRGLLFQRLLTGVILFHSFVTEAAQPLPIVPKVSYAIAAGAGILLLIGLWTPVAGLIVAAAEVLIITSHPENLWMTILLLGLAASLAMIGPGAWSIDARLFGRKQIDISRSST